MIEDILGLPVEGRIDECLLHPVDISRRLASAVAAHGDGEVLDVGVDAVIGGEHVSHGDKGAPAVVSAVAAQRHHVRELAGLGLRTAVYPVLLQRYPVDTCDNAHLYIYTRLRISSRGCGDRGAILHVFDLSLAIKQCVIHQHTESCRTLCRGLSRQRVTICGTSISNFID